MIHRNRYIIAACCVLIVVVTGGAFSPSLRLGFTNWDDDEYVTKNSSITSLSPANMTRIFNSVYVGNYQPFTILTYALEYRLFGLKAHAFHATNVLLHILNCLLVFWLMLLISGKKIAVSLFATLLFAVHPLRVESVTWVSARKDVLCGLFFLGALITYIYYLRHNFPRRLYLFTLLLFLVSLLSKATATVIPILLFLFDYLLRRKFCLKALLEKIPFFIISLLFGVTAFLVQGEGVGAKAFILPYRFFVIFYGFALYARTLILPLKLSAIYPYAPADTVFYAVCAISAAVTLSLAYLIFRTRRDNHTLVFCSLFALVNILPVSQFIPVGSAIIADRYTYLPSVALSYGAVVLFAEGCRAISRRGRVSTVAWAAPLAALALTYAFLTYQRIDVWKNGVSLFSDVLRQYPTSILAYHNRAVAYNDIGDFDRVIEDCDKAIAISPKYADTFALRGKAYYKKGEFGRAIEDISRSIEIDPHKYAVYTGRAVAYNKIGAFDLAITDCNHAIKLKPSAANAYNTRGYAYYQKGDAPRARADYDQALACDPKFAEAYNNRGYYYYSRGDYTRSLADYDKALAIQNDYFECYNNRGCVYYAKGDIERAIADYTKAIILHNRYAEAYANRGLAYNAMNDVERARADYTKAIEEKPDYAKAYYYRARVYYRMGMPDKSREDVQKAQALGYTIDGTILEKLSSHITKR